MFRSAVRIGALVLFLFGLVAGASATSLPASQMDFLGGSGGTISFNPAPLATLDVTDAPISTVTQLPTFLKYIITGLGPGGAGYIDIVTGQCIIGCTINPKTHTSADGFADGGIVDIYGSLPAFPNIPANSLLIQGTFDSSVGSKLFGQAQCPTTNATLNGTTGKGGLQGCVRIESINANLLADLGFPAYKTGGNGYLSELFFQLSLTASGFNGEVKGTDVIIHPMPEPATLALLGAGLLVFGSVARKKLLSRHSARPVART